MSSSPDFDDEHATALGETGFWGRRAAGCLVYCRETDRLLIQKRSSIVLEPNTWGTWGGAVDPGETPVETVYRELREEGVETELLTKAIPVFVFTHESGFSYHNFIVVTEEEFEPVLTWEAADFQWMRDVALFLGAKRLEDGSYAGVQRLMFTTAICIGVTPMTAFQRRYCFNDLGQCLHSYSEIKQLGDEPEGWIARRPKVEEDYLTYNDGPR